MKNNTRRPPLALCSLLPILALALAACSKAPPAPTPVRAVRTLVVTDTGSALDREFAADIRARTESRLGFQVSGKVVRRWVDLGQSVRAGQVLAQLDPKDLNLAQDAARAGLFAAEANAAQASADLKRFTELRGQGFISAAELDRHATAQKAAEASLRQARAQAGVQGNQASYAGLSATAAGVITQVDVEPGQVVSAGMPVLTLAHDGPRDAVFSVPEDMGPVLRPLVGKAGGVQVRRWGGAEWQRATVREMAAAADPITRTLLVKADVGRAGFELGQTASVMVQAPVRGGTGVRIPLHALLERDGKSVVWLLDPKALTVQPVPVATADVVGNTVLVTQGLRPGQEVVTAGAHVLSPGQTVKRYQAPVAEGSASAAQP